MNEIFSGEIKECPECAELLIKDARICRFCGYKFYQSPRRIDQEIIDSDRERKKLNK